MKFFLRDYPLVIERVLSESLNLKEDLEKLDSIYSKETIQKIALSSTQIFGNERIIFMAARYGINTIEFDKYIL